MDLVLRIYCEIRLKLGHWRFDMWQLIINPTTNPSNHYHCQFTLNKCYVMGKRYILLHIPITHWWYFHLDVTFTSWICCVYNPHCCIHAFLAFSSHKFLKIDGLLNHCHFSLLFGVFFFVVTTSTSNCCQMSLSF